MREMGGGLGRWVVDGSGSTSHLKVSDTRGSTALASWTTPCFHADCDSFVMMYTEPCGSLCRMSCYLYGSPGVVKPHRALNSKWDRIDVGTRLDALLIITMHGEGGLSIVILSDETAIVSGSEEKVCCRHCLKNTRHHGAVGRAFDWSMRDFPIRLV